MKRLLLSILVLLILTTGCKSGVKNGQIRVFDPRAVKIGDTIDGFTVNEIFFDDEYGMEKVVFEGNFTLTGNLLVNAIGDSWYMLFCGKEEIEKSLPVATTWELDKHDSNYTDGFILLSDEKVSEAIGKEIAEKMFSNFENGIELEYKIYASFSGFTYWTQPNTDVSSTLELLEILSIEEIQ